LIRYHAEPDKIGQAKFFRVKVTAHDVNGAQDQKELACPVRCILFDAKPQIAGNAGARQLKREERDWEIV
jgi:hypothetical protein